MAVPIWVLAAIGLIMGLLAAALLFALGRLGRSRGELETARLEAVRLEERLRAQVEEVTRLEDEQGEREAENDALREALGRLEAERSALFARMEEQAKAAEAKLALLEDARGRMAEAFQGLSREALETNSKTFLQLAGETLGQKSQAIDQVVQPLKESLGKVECAVR